jgi:ssDNA-binding Zn-finger/Zn-ribbon topoisomerase 1
MSHYSSTDHTDLVCRISCASPLCNAPLILRRNRRTSDPFLGCDNFPRCSFTEEYVSALQDLAAAHVAPITSIRDIDRALRQIIGVVHPDKWQSAGRSAEELAHTLTIELLNLRETVRGRTTS